MDVIMADDYTIYTWKNKHWPYSAAARTQHASGVIFQKVQKRSTNMTGSCSVRLTQQLHDRRVLCAQAGVQSLRHRWTVVAEVARKQTAARVVLGEAVLTLTVGPEVDHLLDLGLVVVYGLINRSM